ncbi:MAG TPA: hypothetical protein PLP14_05340, partial [Chitinophagaceae bacterium]|nr:hypothetical protein [Chitinophagaceae bacterium]
MKSLFLSTLVFMVWTCGATIRTVNNNPAGLAQFSYLQAAVNASASGDTIYVHASASNYGEVEIIDKRIALIGPGISPDRNGPELTATVSVIRIKNINTTNANGSLIMGLHCNYLLEISHNGSGNIGEPVNDVKLIRNRFTDASVVLYVGNNYGSKHMYNLYAEGNYFQNSSIGSASTSYYFTNCMFTNNVFARSNGFGGSIQSMNNCTNVIFDHNVFYGDQTNMNRLFGDYASGLTMKNNVFVNCVTNNTHPNGSYSIFNISFTNNITFNCTNNSPWTLGNNIDGGGNISNQNPQMGSQAAINTGTYSPLHDFSIASGPA